MDAHPQTEVALASHSSAKDQLLTALPEKRLVRRLSWPDLQPEAIALSGH